MDAQDKRELKALRQRYVNRVADIEGKMDRFKFDEVEKKWWGKEIAKERDRILEIDITLEGK